MNCTHDTLLSINQAINKNRSLLSDESLKDTANYLKAVAIPAICGLDEDRAYIYMEKDKGKEADCPTNVTVIYSPWYAEELAASNPLPFNMSTQDMEKTITCSDYNVTVSSLYAKWI